MSGWDYVKNYNFILFYYICSIHIFVAIVKDVGNKKKQKQKKLIYCLISHYFYHYQLFILLCI